MEQIRCQNCKYYTDISADDEKSAYVCKLYNKPLEASVNEDSVEWDNAPWWCDINHMTQKDIDIQLMSAETKEWCSWRKQQGSCKYYTCDKCISEALYAAGYRKEDNTAKEILKEITSDVSTLAWGSISINSLKKIFAKHGVKVDE